MLFKTSLLSILTSSTLPSRVVTHAPKLSKTSQLKWITFSILELLINRPSFSILLETLTLRLSMVTSCSLLLIYSQWVGVQYGQRTEMCDMLTSDSFKEDP